MSATSPPRSGRFLRAALGCVALRGAAPGAEACDVPVFRYAMYNWVPAPHYIFYLHEGHSGEDESIRRANRAIEAPIRERPPANVLFEPVDLAERSQRERLPGLVANVWDQHDPKAGPLYVVVSPWGHVRFAGRLDEDTWAAMLDSPTRRKIAHEFEAGAAVVLVLLEGDRAADNHRARDQIDRAITEAIRLGGAGRTFPSPIGRGVGGEGTAAQDIEPPAAPEDGPHSNPLPKGEGTAGESLPKGEGAVDAGAPSAQPLRIEVVALSRSDPAEKWFVEDLMSVEDDLAEHAGEPIVFALYGRGRAMPPCVGGGITRENLLAQLTFLGGPCSCLARDENPGVDLLFRRDWDALADALAVADDARPLADGQLTYGEFVPGPSSAAPEDPSFVEPFPTEPDLPVDLSASASSSSGSAFGSSESLAGRQMWIAGGVLGVGVLAILLVGALLWRRA